MINPLIATLKPQRATDHHNSNTVIGTLTVDGWAITFGSLPKLLFAVPNVTAHLSGQYNNFVLFDVAL